MYRALTFLDTQTRKYEFNLTSLEIISLPGLSGKPAIQNASAYLGIKHAFTTLTNAIDAMHPIIYFSWYDTYLVSKQCLRATTFPTSVSCGTDHEFTCWVNVEMAYGAGSMTWNNQERNNGFPLFLYMLQIIEADNIVRCTVEVC